MLDRPRYVARVSRTKRTPGISSEFNGWYEKEGGGLTPHLNEARVLGWNAPKKWAWLPARGFELILVTIVIEAQ